VRGNLLEVLGLLVEHRRWSIRGKQIFEVESFVVQIVVPRRNVVLGNALLEGHLRSGIVVLGEFPVARLRVAKVIWLLAGGIILLLEVFLPQIRKNPFSVSRRVLIGRVVNVAGLLLDGGRKTRAAIG